MLSELRNVQFFSNNVHWDDLDQPQIKIKIEDLKDWIKCVDGSDQILSDHQLMFKTNFNVKSIPLTIIRLVITFC
jgi:hypothetical protein